MKILTRKLFEHGCQFQTIGATEKSHLYITKYNSAGHFVLIDYEFACEYGKDMWKHISQVIFVSDDYFVFQYKLLGEMEILNRYYNQFQVVNFTEHKI